MPMPSADDELKPNDRLGKWTVIKPIGAGGMGKVYEARDEVLGRVVALKTIEPKLVAAVSRTRTPAAKRRRRRRSIGRRSRCSSGRVGRGAARSRLREELRGSQALARTGAWLPRACHQ
jgi:serine/threonine protein kinase